MKPMRECRLCPRECKVNREENELGFCGMNSKIKIARAALHYWEEPCLSGKSGSGGVFFSGCNLRCIFCQNYKISTCRAGKYITEDELCDIFLDLQAQGANNINLVTPTQYIPQIIESILKAKKKGLILPIIYNCGGYESVESLRLLEGLVDIYLPDFKYYSNKYAKKYSAVEDYAEKTKLAIDEMVRQQENTKFDNCGIMKSGVIVRHLMLPGLLFDSKKIIDYLHSTYGEKIWISIMNQYTPTEYVKNISNLKHPLNTKHYDALVRYASESGVINAYVQEGGTVDASFIPEFFDDD